MAVCDGRSDIECAARIAIVSDEMESDEHQKRIPVGALQQMLYRIGFTDFLHYTFELGLNNLLVAVR